MRKTKQSTARNVMIFMTDSVDHISGKASLSLTITASKNGAGFNSISPTVTDRGSGWYNLALTTSHTDTLGDLALHITAIGADPTDLLLEVVAYDPNDAFALGLSRVDAAITTRAPESGGNIATIMGKTNNLPTDPADASDIATAFANVPAAVWGYGTRTLSSFGTLIADIYAYAVEGSLTFLQAIRIWMSALAGKSTGGGTSTLTFKDQADSKARISATVDVNGNRTAISVDGS